MSTFAELSFASDDACDICNAAGDIFREGRGLRMCLGCLVLVARARTGNGVTAIPRAKPKGKARVPASDSAPTPLLVDEGEEPKAKEGDPVS